MSEVRKGILIAALVIGSSLAVGIAAVFVLVHPVPPQSLTHAHMHTIKRRIVLHVRETGTLPTTVADLPELDGYTNSINDGWGRPIRMSIDAGGRVTLTSLGADGRAGGIGDDADMRGIFDVWNAYGHTISYLEDWALDPFDSLDGALPASRPAKRSTASPSSQSA